MTSWKTQEWSVRERLEALAAFQPVFEREGFRFAEDIPCRTEGDLIVLGGTALGEDARRFYQMAYDYGWVSVFDLSAWRETPTGQRLMNDPTALDDASAEDLVQVLTTCVRADRLCEGYLASAFEAGLITRVAVRANQLIDNVVEREPNSIRS